MGKLTRSLDNVAGAAPAAAVTGGKRFFRYSRVGSVIASVDFMMAVPWASVSEHSRRTAVRLPRTRPRFFSHSVLR